MTLEELKAIGDAASVSVAASHDAIWPGSRIEPRLWEAFRVELQRRFRRSTGETMAVLTIDLTPPPAQTQPVEAQTVTLEHAIEAFRHVWDGEQDDEDFYADEIREYLINTNPKSETPPPVPHVVGRTVAPVEVYRIIKDVVINKENVSAWSRRIAAALSASPPPADRDALRSEGTQEGVNHG